MRLKIFTSTLTILLATSSWQPLPAADIAIDEQEITELSKDLVALQLLLKYSAPAITPFMQPIQHGFTGLEIPAAIAGIKFLKPIFGKVSDIGGGIFKVGVIAVAVTAVWKTLVTTLGGSYAQRSKTLERTHKERKKAFEEKFGPTNKAAITGAEERENQVAKQGVKIDRLIARVGNQIGRMVSNVVDEEAPATLDGPVWDTLALQRQQVEAVKAGTSKDLLRRLTKIGDRIVAMDQANDKALADSKAVAYRYDTREAQKQLQSLQAAARAFYESTEGNDEN